jgi:hypothetical protein
MLAAAFAVALLLQGPADCSNVRECRQQALDAATAGDYERFHDLAWRAVQKGKPNDPDLMYVLARAQSLSGRPGDALVMLKRLTQLGVATDAATNDDFRRVRSLKEWPDLEAKIAALGNPPAAPKPSVPAAPAPTSAPAPAAAPPAGGAGAAPRELADAPEDALAFSVPPFNPVGLAYDAVSRRFIVGDRGGNRLLVVDELSHHVTPLVSAASAGFFAAITAFEIDARRGDLWVASVNGDGPDSIVHKLQLVSGRVLAEVRLDSDEKARLDDLAVAQDGTVFALDSRSGRIFRLAPGSRRMEVATRGVPAGARSFTLANERTAYVASDEGITRVDLQSKEAATVRLPKGADLGRVEKIRWLDGALLIVGRAPGGETRIGRARMDGSGQRITRVQMLSASGDADAHAVTLSGQLVYYLVGGKQESTIRRARLR